jgi:hypothetical protein
MDMMVEISTKDWPLEFWYEVIQWCDRTFGLNGHGYDKIWYYQDDYSMYIREEYLPFFMLRWL